MAFCVRHSFWRKTDKVHALLKRTEYSTSVLAQPQSRRQFKVIDKPVDRSSEKYQINFNHASKLASQYDTMLSVALSGGGEKAVINHTQRNKKLLARDRLKLLLDKNSDFLEFSTVAGIGMPYGDVPGAGIITGIGKINGVPCSVFVNDATVKGGTIYPISLKKQLRGQEIALHNKIPCVYVVDSGGGFLPLQAEIFPDKEMGGRSFYNQAIMSSEGIPQVAVVCGSCTAGGAYIPEMSEETIHVKRIGHIFLAGPPLVFAALGEKISADDLGGADVHTRVSGCSDYYCETEEEAFDLSRSVYSTLNYPELDNCTNFEEPLFSPDEIPGLIPSSNEMDMHQVLARIVDGSRFHEFKSRYGPTLITGFAHLGGNLVGIVANNGSLNENAAVKGSHFLQICSSRNVPIIFFQNIDKNDANFTHSLSGQKSGDLLRAHSKMMTAVATAKVPKITVVVGGSYGPMNYMMCGKSMSPNFLFVWPNAEIGQLDPKTMTEISVKEAKNSGMSSEDLSKLEEKLNSQFHKQSTAFYSTTNLLDDGMILPKDTRKVLMQCIPIVNYASVHQNSRTPLFRM